MQEEFLLSRILCFIIVASLSRGRALSYGGGGVFKFSVPIKDEPIVQSNKKASPY